MKYVFAYADHELGKLAGEEEKCVPIAAAEQIAEVKPWMIYVDYEEPVFRWWNPFTWSRRRQENTSDAANPT